MGRIKAWEVVFLTKKTGLDVGTALEITFNGVPITDPSITPAMIRDLIRRLPGGAATKPPKRQPAPNTTATRDARKRAAALQRQLRRAGAAEARVRARATGGTWWLRIDIPFAQSAHVTVT